MLKRTKPLKHVLNYIEDKHDNFLDQACRSAFGPDPDEDPDGAKAWNRKVNIMTAIFLVVAVIEFAYLILR